MNHIFDLLAILIFEGVAGGCSLLRLFLCSGKTTQLLIPVTWKGVRHILSFSFKPEDSVDGGRGAWQMGDLTCRLAPLS